MKLHYWGALELQNGKLELLERVCIKCYEALMNDTLISQCACDRCESNSLIVLRENYNIELAKKRIFRNYREYVKCDDCENTFVLEDQTKLENYRKLLAKKTPPHKKLPYINH